MKKILVNLDETTANLLEGRANKSETVRNALKIYNGDISTDSIEGLRASYIQVTKALKELSENLNYAIETIEEIKRRVNNE